MKKLSALALAAILWLGTSTISAQELHHSSLTTGPMATPTENVSVNEDDPSPSFSKPSHPRYVDAQGEEFFGVNAENINTPNDLDSNAAPESEAQSEATLAPVSSVLVSAFKEARHTTINKAVTKPKAVRTGFGFNSPAPQPGVGRRIPVTAFAYCLSGRTASGSRTSLGTIAVDPRVIPLGSKIYVPGYGWGRANDTGGSVRGNKIDIWLPNVSECLRWGVRSTSVVVVP